MATYLIPPNAEFRQHLSLICIILMVYESLRLEEMVPDKGFNHFAPADECIRFNDRIRDAHPERKIPLTAEELLFVYALCYISTLILISPYDQLVMNRLLQSIPESKAWGPITHFRQNVVDDNTHLLKDTEQKNRKLGALQTLKRKLQALTVE